MTRFVSVLVGSLLPPVGVFLLRGLRASFWINLLLTVFFYVPGQIHALWVIAHYRNDGRAADDGFMTFLGLLTCWILPPLAVFLKRGIGLALLLNLVLTVFFWVPGAIHALWTVTDD